MALEQTILTEDDIINILCVEYGLKKPKHIFKMQKGLANVYRIDFQESQYILKEYNTLTKKSVIDKEVSVVKFLQKKGINIPYYKMAINGEYSICYGEKIITLRDYIDGKCLEDNTGTYKQTMMCAKTLGRIVQALKSYDGLEEESVMQTVFSREALQLSLLQLQQYYDMCSSKDVVSCTIQQDLKEKMDMCKYLIHHFDFSVLDKISIMGTHGDYNVQQLVYCGDKVFVLDFETAKKMPVIWEVMRSYSYIDSSIVNGEFNLANLREYVCHFTAFTSLNYYDKKYAAYIYLIQLASSSFGYREYLLDHSKEKLLQFGFYRTKICRYLYKNADEIGKILAEDNTISITRNKRRLYL